MQRPALLPLQGQDREGWQSGGERLLGTSPVSVLGMPICPLASLLLQSHLHISAPSLHAYPQARGIGMAEGKISRGRTAQAVGAATRPPCPSRSHPMHCACRHRLVLLLGARSTRKLPKLVTQGARAGRKETEQRREAPCPASAAVRSDKDDKQQCGGHRAGAATWGKGLQRDLSTVLLLITEFF